MPSNALVYPQNKCICFSLQIGTMHHISEEKINTINCWSNSTPKLNRHSFFEYVNNMCPYYMKEVIEYASQVRLGWTNHYAQNGAKGSHIFVPQNEANLQFQRKETFKYVQACYKKYYLQELRCNIIILIIIINTLSLLLLLLSLLFNIIMLLSYCYCYRCH